MNYLNIDYILSDSRLTKNSEVSYFFKVYLWEINKTFEEGESVVLN